MTNLALPSNVSPAHDDEFIATRPSWLSADRLLRWAAFSSAVSVIVMLIALLWVLTSAAMPAIQTFGWSFLTTSEWRPNVLEQPRRDDAGKIIFEDGEMVVDELPPVFGALAVVYGTVTSSIIALLIAVPLSLGAAIFLIRICPKFLRGPTSLLIEFLAAIPSVAYGIWGLFVLAPFLQSHVEPYVAKTLGTLPGFRWLFFETLPTGVERELPLTGRDMFSGSLILAIMIVPIITAVSRDVLRAVPRVQIEGTLALGATWWQSCWEMLRFSRSGLFGAIMLGLARAAGETMAVTMVIGNNNQIRASLFAPAQTMSSLLANEFTEANGELHRAALCEVALILLVMSLAFNVVARWLVVGKSSRGAQAH